MSDNEFHQYTVTVLEKNLLYFCIESDLTLIEVRKGLDDGEIDLCEYDYDDARVLEYSIQEVEVTN